MAPRQAAPRKASAEQPAPLPPVAEGEEGLLDLAGPGALRRIVVLTASGAALALAAQRRDGGEVMLAALDPGGGFSELAPELSPDLAPDWTVPCRDWLIGQGVPAERITVACGAADLAPADLLINLDGFGDRHRVRHLQPVLATCLNPGSRMILDIRKGSGAFPFLRSFGTCEELAVTTREGSTQTRVLFRAAGDRVPLTPPARAAASAETNTEGWGSIARSLAGPDGFFREGHEHSFLYVPRGDTLVVTFDNLDIAMEKREDRRPWGYSFIERLGWSMLGVMAEGWTWFRDPFVSQTFDDLAGSGFFDQFRRVVFYGASMGGYGACAFSAACPGADVVAISPQSTLDRALVPFETRYQTAWHRDFSGRYGDAALISQAARRVTLLYDPYEPLDAGHVDRFDGANVVRLRTPLLGHRLGSSLHQMGILTPITLGALNGTLTELEFYRTIRARRGFARYQRELFKRALKRGRPALARRLGRWVLTRGDNRYIRKEMLALSPPE